MYKRTPSGRNVQARPIVMRMTQFVRWNKWDKGECIDVNAFWRDYKVYVAVRIQGAVPHQNNFLWAAAKFIFFAKRNIAYFAERKLA